MVNIKSYLNTAIFTARLSAASAAVFILSSCGGKYGNPSLELQDNPAGIYREYLSGIRMQDGLSTDSLTVLLRQWLTVRDSVFAHVRRDTTQQVHSGACEECLTLHDSIRAEFSRLAISRSRTYKEVLTLKERLSPLCRGTRNCTVPQKKSGRSLHRWITPGLSGRQGKNTAVLPCVAFRDAEGRHTRP